MLVYRCQHISGADADKGAAIRVLFYGTDYDFSEIVPAGRFARQPSLYYRAGLIARELVRAGEEAAVVPTVEFDQRSGTFVGLDFFGNRYTDADVIVLVRQVIPHQSAVEIRRARASGQLVIADMDDTWRPDETIPFMADSLREVKESELKPVDLCDLFSALSAFTVSTDAIAAEVREIAPDLPVFVLRNAVDVGA